MHHALTAADVCLKLLLGDTRDGEDHPEHAVGYSDTAFQSGDAAYDRCAHQADAPGGASFRMSIKKAAILIHDGTDCECAERH